MAIDLTKLTASVREPMKLADGIEYPVRDLSLAGAAVLERSAEHAQADPEGYLAALREEAQNLTGAPMAVIMRHGPRELTAILLHAADRLARLQAELARLGEAAAPVEASPPAPTSAPKRMIRRKATAPGDGSP